MSFGPPLLIKPEEPLKPWTRRDSWWLAAYAICSAATISTALYVAQHHQPQPPSAVTKPAVTQPAANLR